MRYIFFLLLFLYLPSAYTQTQIKGFVYNDSKQAVNSASIILKDSISSSILKYTFTDNNGLYKIETESTGQLVLEVKALGYESKRISIAIKDNQQNIENNIFLAEKPLNLDEVIIQADAPITVKKDTITFKASAFTRGNEEVVEDLLKNIPGLNIDSEGTIKIGNQEVEKVMVDGDDFFEKGYKILTKNMPANPIDKIELLKRYSNNRLLKGIEDSDKVALNLKLKEDAKRIWFGNVDLGYGVAFENRYDAAANLSNFGKKNKYYFLANANNTGKDATGDIYQLIRPFRFNEPGSIGDDVKLSLPLSLQAPILQFKRQRTNFNNAELVSLNAIFNPSEKLKVKALGFFNWDEQDFFRNSTSVTTVNDANFTNIEDYVLKNKQVTGFGKLDLNYNISKTSSLELVTKFNRGNLEDVSDINFNGVSTIENLNSDNSFFDQKLSYTNKFKDKKVFLLTGRFINESTPQRYGVNQFFYEELFPQQPEADNVAQHYKGNLVYGGFEGHLLDRKKKGHLLEFKIGSQYNFNSLQTNFFLLDGNEVLEAPSGFQNDLEYITNDLYFKSSLRYKLKGFAVNAELDLHQFYNSYESSKSKEESTPFFINPSLGFNWEVDERNKLALNYSYNTTNAQTLDVYDNFLLTGYRSFNKGTGSFDLLDVSSLTFNYTLGNFSDRFFGNILVQYTKNIDFFTYNSTINQDFNTAEKLLINDREFLTSNANVDYYFKTIRSNLKLNLGYSYSEYQNIVNGSALREITSNRYNYGFEIRSGFKGIFNYHFGTSWTTNTIQSTIDNSFTDSKSFLDLAFIFSETFNINLESERYQFGNLAVEDTYYFLDVNARYTVKKNKLSFAIDAKNLFNTERFTNFSISDIGTSTTTYRLLPRFVLLSMKYRF